MLLETSKKIDRSSVLFRLHTQSHTKQQPKFVERKEKNIRAFGLVTKSSEQLGNAFSMSGICFSTAVGEQYFTVVFLLKMATTVPKHVLNLQIHTSSH